MGLTLPEALKLTRNPFMALLAKAIATEDELAASLIFEPVAGTSFDYMREKALPTYGAWLSDAGTSTEESAATFDRVTVQLRRLVGNVDVDAFAQALGSGEASQEMVQIAKKGKAIFREISRAMILGAQTTGHTFPNAASGIGLAVDSMTYGPGADSSRAGPGSIKYTHVGTFWQYRAPGDIAYGAQVAIAADGSATLYSDNQNKWIRVTVDVSDVSANEETLLYFTSSGNEPDGLNKLLAPSMVVASSGTNGDSLSFNLLDKAIHQVKVRERLAFVMPSVLVEKFGALTRAMGGAQPSMLTVPGFVGQVPSYRGIPILRNDNIPQTETKGTASNLTSFYLMSLSSDVGFYAGAAGGASFDVDADPRRGPVLGLNVERVGVLEGKDAVRTRMKWYGGFALKSPLAAARYQEIAPT